MKKKDLTYSLEGKLSRIAFQFEELEGQLSDMQEVWDFICANYNGHPLQNVDEFTNDVNKGAYG